MIMNRMNYGISWDLGPWPMARLFSRIAEAVLKILPKSIWDGPWERCCYGTRHEGDLAAKKNSVV